jgi:hypothetical protein
MGQPAPKDKDFIAAGNERWTPTALYARDPLDWLGEKPLCRQILEDLVERELASLRKREERLRINYEVPARDGAEARRQVLVSPEGVMLLRHERAHTLTYHRAYDAFLKGRVLSLKTGRLPGAPDPVADDTEQARAAVDPAAAPGATAVTEGRDQRKRAAEELAPGPDNGIGAADRWGDFMMDTVLKEKPKVIEAPEGSQQEQALNNEGSRSSPPVDLYELREKT